MVKSNRIDAFPVFLEFRSSRFVDVDPTEPTDQPTASGFGRTLLPPYSRMYDSPPGKGDIDFEIKTLRKQLFSLISRACHLPPEHWSAVEHPPFESFGVSHEVIRIVRNIGQRKTFYNFGSSSICPGSKGNILGRISIIKEQQPSLPKFRRRLRVPQPLERQIHPEQILWCEPDHAERKGYATNLPTDGGLRNQISLVVNKSGTGRLWNTW